MYILQIDIRIFIIKHTRDSPSSAMISLAVAISIACFKCSARCSGDINLVVSRNCANGLCTKTIYE